MVVRPGEWDKEELMMSVACDFCGGFHLKN